MRIINRLAGLPVLLTLVYTFAPADDWPQWRGPERDGKSSESGLLDSWPAAGPKLLWQTDDLGDGYSTPSAAGGIAYVISNKSLAAEEVVALSLSDGSKLWATKIGPVGKNQGPQYPGTRSTPTIDGDKLYALGSDGDLACLDAKSGSIKWSKNLRSDFGGKPGKWAYAESPLIDGDALICSPGGSEATVVALNKSDGKPIWKAPLAQADDAGCSSPVVATIAGTKQYVLFLSKGVVGLKAETGELLWRYTGTSDKDANVQTPVVSGNLVYTGAGRVGGGLVRVSAGESEPEEVYFERTMPSGMGGNILVDGLLFGTSGPTQICIDFETGDIKWQDRGIGAASLCYADGKIFSHGENNDVAVIEATGEGYKELTRFTPPGAPTEVKGKAWTYPIIVDGKLVIRHGGTIWCYDISG
ncbi:outer membrane biogenesis protein BamB [Stieleria maiorica]|uniref:Outer membrane biogenesis protein BamB n=1 Tax=Stieleria maiorica TaxID=2795974 RepID=A0A5B9M6C4_9BACT|nr:PQQ-binding-like beta-propeller repeat protein [Stieleria maiorica]QEF96622.1 outer membrane biogenesis protein BamB [Stieleria maiorica]